MTPWVLEQVSHSIGIPAPTKEENEGVSSSAHNRATFQGEGERVLAGVGGPSDFVVEGVAVENDTAIAGERVRKFAGNAFQQNSEYLTGGYFAGNVGRCFYKCGKIKVGDHKSKSNVRVKIWSPDRTFGPGHGAGGVASPCAVRLTGGGLASAGEAQRCL